MEANLLLETWLKELKIEYEKEKQFYPPKNLDRRPIRRPYYFDYYLPDTNIVIEIDGAVCKGFKGGHTSITGYQRGCLKANAAIASGYHYLRMPAHWFTENVDKAHQMSSFGIYCFLQDVAENPESWRNL